MRVLEFLVIASDSEVGERKVGDQNGPSGRDGKGERIELGPPPLAVY